MERLDLGSEWDWQHPARIPSSVVRGFADFVTDTAIIETKFKRDFELSDFIQLFLYGLFIDPLQTKRRALLNLRTGEAIRFRFSKHTHRALVETIFKTLPADFRFKNHAVCQNQDPILGVDNVDASFIQNVYSFQG